MMKRLLSLLCAMLLLCGCMAAPPDRPASGERTETGGETPESALKSATEETGETATRPRSQEFWLTFAGDCTLGCEEEFHYYDVGFSQTVGTEYDYPFANVLEYFQNDDFSMVNLECVLAESGTPVPKEYNFRGSPDYVRILTENSVDTVTLANNHSYDYGEDGYRSTLQALDAAGVHYAQAGIATVVTTPSGLTIGIYAVTYLNMDPDVILADIAALAENKEVELVIFAPHWGIENTYRPQEDQQRLARAAIDAGADIVFGTHPHVLQPVEEYAGGIIYYSLGNFVFGGNTNPGDYDTAILRQQVIRESDGTVRLGQLQRIPCSISSQTYFNNYQPTPYAPGTEEYDRVLQKLSGEFCGSDLPL